jgi:hypothetical protein
MTANPRTFQKKNPRVPEGRGGGRVEVMEPQIWIPTREKIRISPFFPMSAIPRNAEAAPKDGLVTPPTTCGRDGKYATQQDLGAITDSLMKTHAPDEMNRNSLIFSGVLFDGYLIGSELKLFSRKPAERHL